MSLSRGSHISTVKRSSYSCSCSCMSPKFVSAVAQYLKYGCTAWELFWRRHAKFPAHGPVLDVQHQIYGWHSCEFHLKKY